VLVRDLAARLIEPAELRKPQVAAEFRALDVRSKKEYQAGHIPGAVWVDVEKWSKTFAEGVQRDIWARLIGSLGIKDDDLLVIYDNGRATDAAQIWWILHYWSYEYVQLLDGGWQGWIAGAGNSTTTKPSYPGESLKLRGVPARLVDRSQVLEAVRVRDEQIIDARTLDQMSAGRAIGSIPTAKRVASSAVLDENTRRFKPPKELAKLFAAAEIDLSQPVITFGQSGGEAALVAFTLELMGARNVRIYIGGWEDWQKEAMAIQRQLAQ
jgi:thiosulfate/3-mercaptopyruvate sulfurtransferase